MIRREQEEGECMRRINGVESPAPIDTVEEGVLLRLELIPGRWGSA